jgi:hypothetical protein
MKYMLMMHTGAEADKEMLDWAPDDVKRMLEFQFALDKDLRDRGEMVFNEGLTFPDQARIVRADGTGAPVVTDGPFSESKEFLIGFWIVDVESPERAYEIAARASTVPGPKGEPMRIPIEVRPVGAAPSVDA